jgi:hypothetical protein
MVVQGTRVEEISAPIEGAYLDFTNSSDYGYLPLMTQAINNQALVQMLGDVTKDTFTTYLQSSALAYNHKERELWVINPNKTYSYVFSRGQWSKVKQTASAIVEDYPNTYLYNTAKLYEIGSEGTAAIPVMLLTRPLKVGTQAFKQAYRVVLRGLMEPVNVYTGTPQVLSYARYAGLYLFGSYDGIKWAFMGGIEKTGLTRDIGTTIERVDCRFFRLGFVGTLSKDSSLDYIEISARTKMEDKIR